MSARTSSSFKSEDGRKNSAVTLNNMQESSVTEIRTPDVAVLEQADRGASTRFENNQETCSSASTPVEEARSSQNPMDASEVRVSADVAPNSSPDEYEDVFHSTNFGSLLRLTFNWIGQFFDDNSFYRRQALWPIIFFSFIYVGACVIASVVVLSLTWNKPCDNPLKYWVLFNSVISLL